MRCEETKGIVKRCFHRRRALSAAEGLAQVLAYHSGGLLAPV